MNTTPLKIAGSATLASSQTTRRERIAARSAKMGLFRHLERVRAVLARQVTIAEAGVL